MRKKKNQQMENITLEVECDADRFACELLFDRYGTALHKRKVQGKNVNDEWNSGCDRPKLWQAYASWFALSSKGLGQVSSNILALNILMRHKNEE